MYDSPFEVAQLLYKYKTKTLTDEAEKAQLQAWLSSSPSNQRLFDKVVSQESYRDYASMVGKIDVDKAWHDFQLKKRSKRGAALQNNAFMYVASIAVILLLLVGAYWWFQYHHSPEDSPQAELSSTPRQIVPGSTRATLTLSSGKQVHLEEGRTISSEQVAELNQQQGDPGRDLARTNSTIETPIGGEYRLILSDSSSVVLNSQTKVRFPDSFAGDKREITLLYGEIFLHVSHNRKSPFFVVMEGIHIKVTGTSFNISTYDNEYQATLVEGSIEIALNTGESYNLNPSEQLTFRPGSDNVQIRVVDTDLYTSWVNGRFVFKDETIEEIMKKLERWYNFKTRFETSGLKSYRFGVNIDKYENITPILKVLESTGTLRFELEGDTILVKEGKSTNK